MLTGYYRTVQIHGTHRLTMQFALLIHNVHEPLNIIFPYNSFSDMKCVNILCIQDVYIHRPTTHAPFCSIFFRVVSYKFCLYCCKSPSVKCLQPNVLTVHRKWTKYPKCSFIHLMV